MVNERRGVRDVAEVVKVEVQLDETRIKSYYTGQVSIMVTDDARWE